MFVLSPEDDFFSWHRRVAWKYVKVQIKIVVLRRQRLLWQLMSIIILAEAEHQLVLSNIG